MKKKILSFCFVFALLIPAILLLSACGKENSTTKKERTNTAQIVRVYQDYGANVYAEMTGFEHDNYELTGSVRDNVTLEFSINNGAWFECYPVQDFYDESGKGIYQILSATYDYGDTEVSSYTTIMTDQNVEPGQISISARIPESNTYYASAGTTPTNYTLKQNIQTIDDKIRFGIHGLGSQGYSGTFEEEIFVFYQDSSNPYTIKVGKFYSEPNGNDGYNYFVRELTTEEESQFSTLNLEYKVVNYNRQYITTMEGTTDENIDSLSIASDENDAVYTNGGWTNSLNLNQNNLWAYTNSGFVYEYVIFLVRQKATDDTVQSSAMCFEVYIGSEELTQTNQ